MANGSIEYIACYRILRRLGEGGMGIVFEAEHTAIARRVAIKLLHPQFAADKSILARFYNEARAVNLIDHPGLVQVLDYGQREDGSSYFVMELLKGETLSARLRRTKTGMALPKVLSIGRQIATALAAAHDKGIVHRDLKLDNVMLVPDAEAAAGERVKILDFGIAKLAPDADVGGIRTSTQLVVGTPAYMAPEQCRGASQVDDRADVYSLGVVLYELLVGQRPFLGKSFGELMGQHMFMAPPAISQALPGVPAAIDTLVASLLRKDRGQRPRMADVASRLAEMSELYSSGSQPSNEQPDGTNLATQVLGEMNIEALNTGALIAKHQLVTQLPISSPIKEQTAYKSLSKVRRWLPAVAVLSAIGCIGMVSLSITAPRDLRTSDQVLPSTAPPQTKAVSSVLSAELPWSDEPKRPDDAGVDPALPSHVLAQVSVSRTGQQAELPASKDQPPSLSSGSLGLRSGLPTAHGVPRARRGMKATETATAENRARKQEEPLASRQQSGLESKGAEHEILED